MSWICILRWVRWMCSSLYGGPRRGEDKFDRKWGFYFNTLRHWKLWCNLKPEYVKGILYFEGFMLAASQFDFTIQTAARPVIQSRAATFVWRKNVVVVFIFHVSTKIAIIILIALIWLNSLFQKEYILWFSSSKYFHAKEKSLLKRYPGG